MADVIGLSPSMVCDCRVRLTERRFLGFSILAVLLRATVGAHKAGGDEDDAPGSVVAKDSFHLASIFARRTSGQGMEFLAKRSQAGVTDLKAHLSDRHVAL